jgi:hypothetical protein
LESPKERKPTEGLKYVWKDTTKVYTTEMADLDKYQIELLGE